MCKDVIKHSCRPIANPAQISSLLKIWPGRQRATANEGAGHELMEKGMGTSPHRAKTVGERGCVMMDSGNLKKVIFVSVTVCMLLPQLIVFVGCSFKPVSREGRVISCVSSCVAFHDRTLFCRPDGRTSQLSDVRQTISRLCNANKTSVQTLSCQRGNHCRDVPRVSSR